VLYQEDGVTFGHKDPVGLEHTTNLLVLLLYDSADVILMVFWEYFLTNGKRLKAY
jgi:hypothetical protein